MDKLYMIGNAHIDPVWLWRWQDGYSEVLASWRSALDRMIEFEDFKFTAASAVYYQWIEKTDPAMFAEIQQRVKEGRWDITGGWFLQPDCNIPSGESFARHTLIAQRYFKDRFGITARSGYNVDSFGHCATIPKILRAGGMSRYVFMRPSETENADLPERFAWRADDGSTVSAYRIYGSYNVIDKRFDQAEELCARIAHDGQNRMVFYGVGNHGGGATSELIHSIKKQNWPNAVFSTVDEYFDRTDLSNLPTVSGELHHHARGCYSANAWVKAMNRKCEENIIAAERFSLLANRLVGFQYPKKALRKAWKNLLFNQFHDIVTGCAIESAYEDASYLYGEAMSITEQTINAALQAICRKIDTGSDSKDSTKNPAHKFLWENDKLGTPIVVFNPHAFPVQTTVTLRICAARITEDQGAEIPFQLIRGEQTNHHGDVYVVTFPVSLPAYGYRVYRAFQSGEATVQVPPVRATEHSLENELVRVEFDSASGEISKIIDKASGRILADGGMHAILTDETACDTWGHGEFDLGKVCGAFEKPEFSVLEEGSVCATLRVRTYYGESTLTRDYTLKAGSDEVLVQGEIDFWEKHKALKITFPAKDRMICDVPYGTVERPLEIGEEPFGRWFASNGLGVANNGKYGYDSTDREMRMTILRGAIWADHYGTRDERCRFMDRGLHRFTYSIFPYTTRTDAHRRAALLNAAPRAVTESFHYGSLPTAFSGFSSDREELFVTAIKQAEDGDLAVLRCFETEGTDVNATVRLFGKALQIAAPKYSIQTRNEEGTALNFMEWEEA